MSSTNRGGQRTPADNYPTPTWCVRRLLEEKRMQAALSWQARDANWCEPCAGDGAIIRAANEVYSSIKWTAMEIRPECQTDLHSLGKTFCPQDFLQTSFDFEFLPSTRIYDVIITNPPFSLAMEFLKQCLELERPLAWHVIFLLRLNFLASAQRNEFLRKHIPDVYVLPNRPSFDKKGTDSIEYAWFHFHKYAAGALIVLPVTSLEERKRG